MSSQGRKKKAQSSKHFVRSLLSQHHDASTELVNFIRGKKDATEINIGTNKISLRKVRRKRVA